MRGRKPQAGAERRGGRRPEPEVVEAVARPVSSLAKPESVEENPTMSGCWDLVVGNGSQYTPADIPQLEQLCYWYAVYRQCMQNTLLPDGRVVTQVCKVDEEGRKVMDTIRAHPDVKTAQIASANYRTLAGELGISPLARQRMGLMDAMTHSSQADLALKTKQLYEQFKAGLPDAKD